MAKKEDLLFEVYEIEGTKENLIGQCTLDVRELKKQEEYEITLDIIDDLETNKINSSINTKILFIWSYTQYYNDLKNKSDKLIDSYNSVLDKTENLLTSLNGKSLLFKIHLNLWKECKALKK